MVLLLNNILNFNVEHFKFERLLDDDKNAYKVLAMLLEPIVSESFEKMKKEQGKQGEGEQLAMPKSGTENNQNSISC